VAVNTELAHALAALTVTAAGTVAIVAFTMFVVTLPHELVKTAFTYKVAVASAPSGPEAHVPEFVVLPVMPHEPELGGDAFHWY
jgi:hypothetical protein